MNIPKGHLEGNEGRKVSEESTTEPPLIPRTLRRNSESPRQPKRLPWPEKAIPETTFTRRKIRVDPTESDSIRLNHFLFRPISRRLMFGVPPSGGQGLVDYMGRVNAGLQTSLCYALPASAPMPKKTSFARMNQWYRLSNYGATYFSLSARGVVFSGVLSDCALHGPR
jgi:hypothetical protein